ncbi:hypothetical protein IW261DRAFT_1683261 [Armillaria novae-zelandiae]|uniref:Uncharacterized protein n=1 Tax=Armillaria novae-zelandiae TaxID=153914 RepID=A0AA39UJX8_9AGAR|nr:hypothetical protein IW261DRAFT_1423705 [Armillaria novae-zelandiae]KAK0481931.1 hypothetical protein IW261DRAFT_1418896 [Armillaria novae-zelandiae]KAK0481935.1 hypothetical protein IW261DRAFT_1683261 [Armillaria novae-zelandiae]
MLMQPVWAPGAKCQCLWADKIVCGKEDSTHASTNWAVHFAQEHGLNICATITVDHCTQCGLWFEDEVGDQSECADGDVDLQPCGVGIHDNLVMFDLADGLGSSHPELYEYIDQNVAIIPLYHPYYGCISSETTEPGELDLPLTGLITPTEIEQEYKMRFKERYGAIVNEMMWMIMLMGKRYVKTEDNEEAERIQVHSACSF